MCFSPKGYYAERRRQKNSNSIIWALLFTAQRVVFFLSLGVCLGIHCNEDYAVKWLKSWLEHNLMAIVCIM